MDGYRLGLYDADPGNSDVELCGPVFGNSENDRRVIAKVLAKFRRFSLKYPEVTKCLGLFSVSNRDKVRDTPSDVFEKTK